MRETKTAIATGIGGVGLGGLMTAADQLDWDFPAEVLWALAILSIIGLFVSGAIWVHLGYEWYQRQRGNLMSGAVGLLLIGIFLAGSGGFLAWKGWQSALAIYQTEPKTVAKTTQKASEETHQTGAIPVAALPRAIPPTPQPAPPPKSLAGGHSYPPPPNKELVDPAVERTLFDMDEAKGTVQSLSRLWLNEKLSGSGASQEEVSGLVLPPDDWMNQRLARMGRPYRVKANGSLFYIFPAEITK